MLKEMEIEFQLNLNQVKPIDSSKKTFSEKTFIRK